MNTIAIDDYALRLYTAHGDRAEYEAAQKAKDCEDQGRQGDRRAVAAGARRHPHPARAERELTPDPAPGAARPQLPSKTAPDPSAPPSRAGRGARPGMS